MLKIVIEDWVSVNSNPLKYLSYFKVPLSTTFGTLLERKKIIFDIYN